ncbi:MAG: fused MFS/spermidine synthase, partial [Armatimonadota bacterium]
PLPTLLLSGLTLLLCCIILGAQFGLACALVSSPRSPQAKDSADRGARAVGRIFVLEAAGAVAGGLIFHFWLADHLQSMSALAAVGVVNTALAAWLAMTHLSRGARASVAAFAGAVGLALAAAAFVPPIARGMDRASMRARWRGYTLAAAVNSRYGALAVTRSGRQVSFYHDGLLAFTTEDDLANEELAHLTMLEARDTSRVLFVSGGLGGAIAEVLKHGVERLDYVELDSRQIQLALAHLPSRLKEPLHDPRVCVHLGDGRVFVRDAKPDAYDVVIVNVPDPSTAMLNRFYTEEFFREVARALRPRGIVSVSLSAAEAGPGGNRRLLYASVLKALKRVFPDVIAVVPVTKSRVFFFGCATAGVLTHDAAVLVRRLRERGVTGAFVSPEWVEQQHLPAPAWDLFVMSVQQESEAATNRDFLPVSYQYWLRMWVSQYSSRAARALSRADRWTRWIWAVPGLAALVALVLGTLWPAYPRAAVTVVLAGTGFVEMGLQLMVLFAFQTVAGYLFYQIGILTTLYMAGLAVGGELGRRLVGRSGGTVAAAFAICLPGLVVVSAAMPWAVAGGIAGPEAVKVMLGGISLIGGALGGCAYAVAVRLASSAGRRPHDARDAGRAGAALYAADLVGGALGAILVSVLVLPALGLWQTCYGLAILSATGLILAAPLLLRRARRGRLRA